MDFQMAKKIARQELDRFPELSGWQVVWSTRALRTLSRTESEAAYIMVSKPWTRAVDYETFVSWFRHEMAHALVGGRNHYKAWQAANDRTGGALGTCKKRRGPVGVYWEAGCNCEPAFLAVRRRFHAPSENMRCFRCRTPLVWERYDN